MTFDINKFLYYHNRSWMKQIHRDCFLGSDAVTFMVEQGFADSRAAAVILGQSMMEKKLLKHVVDSRRKFRDAYMYYRFTEDDNDNSVLSQTNAGNGADIHLGQSGCKFSFAPHTAHNSFVLDVALAEELERVVAGASIEARANTFAKLRERVREQASPDAENWVLCQSTEFNKVSVNVYERIRPRGDFKNVRMTGVVGQTPKSFIAGMMDFSRRSLWDSMFEDGVMVESINLGADLVLSDAAPGTTIPNSPRSNKLPNASDAENPTRENTAGRGEDDIDSFLETVDLAGSKLLFTSISFYID